MAQVAQQLEQARAADRSPISSRPLIGVALASFAALLLELSLTRLFSVILFYHFAFLAISVALLGLGAGGVFAYLRRRWLARYPMRSLAAACCTINAVATFLVLEIVLHIPVSLGLSSANFLKLTVIYLSSALPFFFTGLLLATVFARNSQQVPMLYGADLAGGALACLAVVPLLDLVGGPGAVIFAAVAMALAGAAWALGSRGRKVALTLAAALLALITANRFWSLVDVVYAKGVRVGSVAQVEFVGWNAISRIEVDRKPDQSKWIVIDADANSAIVNVNPLAWNGVWQRDLMSVPPGAANVLRPHGDYAIIGPGGGVDVLRAVANGSPSVTGIEINPLIANTIMRGQYADYSYNLYALPQVRMVVSDGRSFIRGSKAQFDVIQMTLVDTWASTAAGAFALSESYLYTTEAFEQYFQHLKPDGLVAVTRWEFKQPREALRVASVALEALRRLGATNPARNFMVISDGSLNEDGRPVAVLAKKSPFTAAEELRVQAYLQANPNLRALYLPSAPGNNPFSQLITSGDPGAFVRSYPYNISPVGDDAPFFFFTLKMPQVLAAAGETHRGIDWKVSLGVVVLGIVLLISILAVLALLILPLALGGPDRPKATLGLVYFVALGLGYILVEITFVQRLVLYLGHPTYAITVVIFLMLLSSGVGSLVSRRLALRPQSLHLPLAVIVGALLAYTLVLPSLLTSGVGLSFGLKLLVSGALLAPLGFVMGMPFPTGLRAVAAAPEDDDISGLTQDTASATDAKGGLVEWAWALNAGSSVLGSVLAIVIAINFGLKITLACGATAYLAAWALSHRVIRPSGHRVIE
ncbi:MAG TPA: hypothetical protein VMT20_05220 [Terriglobia bacterium]|nr:hypothetical protein [Terriglobia bacterium]